MKTQFLHEHNARQDKAKKPHYREEMLLGPTRRRAKPKPKPKPPEKPKFKTHLTIRRNFHEVSPLVLAALHRLEPSLNLQKLIEAINSALGDSGCNLHGEFELPKMIAAIRRAFPANQATSRHIAHRFLQWHDKVIQAHSQCPSASIQVPRDFHDWLRKMTPATPIHHPSVTSPSSASGEPNVPS
jgi:hypothetical protein